jgi:hypothetical protein
MFALAACTPPAEETPPAPQAQQEAATAGDCVAAAEAVPNMEAPQPPPCDWAALAAAHPGDPYVGYFDSAHEAVDGALAIAPRGDGDYVIGVSAVFAPTSHMCGGVFDARAAGDALALTPRDAGGEACSVRVAPGQAPGDLTMQAQGDCTYFCGARASLDGLPFRRRD